MPALGLARGKSVYMLFIYLIRVTEETVDIGRQDRIKAELIEMRMNKDEGGGCQEEVLSLHSALLSVF